MFQCSLLDDERPSGWDQIESCWLQPLKAFRFLVGKKPPPPNHVRFVFQKSPIKTVEPHISNCYSRMNDTGNMLILNVCVCCYIVTWIFKIILLWKSCFFFTVSISYIAKCKRLITYRAYMKQPLKTNRNKTPYSFQKMWWWWKGCCWWCQYKQIDISAVNK